MAVIVRDKKSNHEFLLLGTGLGAFQSTNPTWGNREKGEYPMVSVCDHLGAISWVYSDELEVIEVDGKTPSEQLSKYLK
jgi:hypothetical protein